MGHSGEGRMSGVGSETSFQTSSVPERNSSFLAFVPEINYTRLLSVWGPASLLGRDPGYQHQMTGVRGGYGGVGDGDRRREGRMTGDTERMIDQVWGEGMI